MRALMIAFGMLAISFSAAHADDIPTACRPNAAGEIDWSACAAGTKPGEDVHMLALINLGSEALMRHDYVMAVRYYDEAQPPSGQQMYSDMYFHAFRAEAYSHVGRMDEAVWNARAALLIMRDDESIPADVRRLNREYPAQPDMIYALIVPVLHDAHDDFFESALAAYMALPSNDAVDFTNRAAVLQQIGRNDEALALNTQALSLAPDEPGVLNNQCYILTLLHRGSEGAPFCVRALEAAPNEAAIHDSYAAALADSGDCAKSAQERALAHRLDPSSPEYAQRLECGTH